MKLNWNFSRDRVDSGPAILLLERKITFYLIPIFPSFPHYLPHALFRTGEASPLFLENVFLKSGVPSAQVLDPTLFLDRPSTSYIGTGKTAICELLFSAVKFSVI